jgi:tetraacyldisaccharide-1-P 4'-kinase
MPLIIAMTPTWNEAENIGPLMDALLALNEKGRLPSNCELQVLVVDDNSPDGTWRFVRERQTREPRVHLLHRTKDKGRGLAGIAGFREALRLGADYVIEMDADFSHDPKWIPSMVEKALTPPGADVVIGSRLVPGGGEQGRHGIRKMITLAANAYIRGMLRLPVRDATSGYRLFSRPALEAVPWNVMRATGPEVVQEVLLAIHTRDFALAEVPILFVERRAGQSSFNIKIMLRSLFAMARLRFFPGELTPPREDEPPIDLPTPVAIPLSWLYALGRRVDRMLHLAKILPRRRLPVPVVCVGNLSVGGTGKTPMVRYLTEILQEAGYHPAILSRGYGAARTPAKPLVVSDEHRLLATPEQAGDEPCLLAAALPGVPIIVHPNRYAAGRLALKRFTNDLLILDDGFQHDALERDLDLVLWDARDRSRRMRVLPAGRMREPLSALRRAHAIIITHTEYLPQEMRAGRLERLKTRLARRAPQARIFVAETSISGWRRLSGRHGDEDSNPQILHTHPWANRRILLLAGLARPSGFEALIRATEGLVTERFFYPDHFPYSSDEITLWHRALERTGADMMLTTEKDAAKLAHLPLGGLNLLAVDIRIQVETPDDFRAWLLDRLPAPQSTEH